MIVAMAQELGDGTAVSKASPTGRISRPFNPLPASHAAETATSHDD